MSPTVENFGVPTGSGPRKSSTWKRILFFSMTVRPGSMRGDEESRRYRAKNQLKNPKFMVLSSGRAFKTRAIF